MSKQDVFPLSVSSYVADTQHLGLEQHGAYLLILMAMWRAGGELPNDEKMLANICRLTVSKWRKIAGPVMALLTIEGAKITQNRLRKEAENLKQISRANAQNGRAGGIAKSLKTKDADVATASKSLPERQPVATGDANAAIYNKTNISDSEIPKKDSRASRDRGEKLPDDWVPHEKHYQRGAEQGMTRNDVDRCAQRMREWSIANANRREARKSNWNMAFYQFIEPRNARRFGRGGETYGQRSDQPRPAGAPDAFLAAAHRRAGAMHRDNGTSGSGHPNAPPGWREDAPRDPRGGGQTALDLDFDARSQRPVSHDDRR